MAKILAPLAILFCISLLAAGTLAQMEQMSPEEVADLRRMEAESLLNDLNSMDLENPEAQEARDMANNAYDQGMVFYNFGQWEDAVQSFDSAISYGGDVMDIEGVPGEDYTEPEIPDFGDGIDVESMGQGVRESDFPILMGIIFISVLVVLPVTYKLV